MTFDEIVTDNIREYRDDACAEMRFFETLSNPAEAIRKAALYGLPSRKRQLAQP
jgi:hypothetical protein